MTKCVSVVSEQTTMADQSHFRQSVRDLIWLSNTSYSLNKLYWRFCTWQKYHDMAKTKSDDLIRGTFVTMTRTNKVSLSLLWYYTLWSVITQTLTIYVGSSICTFVFLFAGMGRKVINQHCPSSKSFGQMLQVRVGKHGITCVTYRLLC
jgi:hypothetical protein